MSGAYYEKIARINQTTGEIKASPSGSRGMTSASANNTIQTGRERRPASPIFDSKGNVMVIEVRFLATFREGRGKISLFPPVGRLKRH